MQPSGATDIRNPRPVVLSLLLLAVPAGLGTVPAADGSGPSCEDPAAFVWVEAMGPACPILGGWLVRLPDGSTRATHGPDPAPAEPGHIPFSTTSVPRAAACATDLGTERRGVLVYARPYDKPDGYDAVRSGVRAIFEKVQGVLREESEGLGSTVVRFRMECEGPWAKVLKAAPLPTPSTADSFASIVGDLQAQGLHDPLVKYWVWYDASAGTFAGQADLCHDDRLVASNCNLGGPDYAITFRHGADIMLHEALHNLGAVQLSAPNSTGAYHCNDGLDIMCYNDGGPRAHQRVVCSGYARVDCLHDDYFHTQPPADNYLATHWNVGSPLNVFLAFADRGELPGAPRDLAATPGPGRGQVTLSWQPPAGGPAPSGYRVYRGEAPALTFLHAEAGGATSFTDTGLLDGARWTYRVVGVNARGEGDVTGAVEGMAPTRPPPPFAPVAAALPTGEVRLAWAAPTTTGGVPLLEYRIYRQPCPLSLDCPLGSLVGVRPAGDPVVLASDTPPGPGLYLYTVTSVNVVGQSAPSQPGAVLVPDVG